MKRRLALLAALTLLCSTACAPMVGVPSLTLLSRDSSASSLYTAVGGTAKTSDCRHWGLILFIWGDVAPSHEAVVTRMLEEHDADAILNARITTSQYGLPYLYMQTCTNVEGTPARLGGSS